ncbi:MAG: pyrroline-5-carboxylate reductase [Oligoflexales bacterium]|nr:pyrroline-5-carboxylate reductase [Oligoflexales bacterium]
MKTNITIIGVGNMGRSLARGLLGSQLSSSISLSLYDKNITQLSNFRENDDVRFVENLEKELHGEGVVVLCVKPQDLSLISDELKGCLSRDSLIISILAGVRTQDIAEMLGHEGGVVRAMPNIAATVGQAATGMCCNSKCTESQKSISLDIFKAVGEAYWTKESLMDTVTGLSGSGPAYIYMVIEALTDGGVKMGLPRDLAKDLSVQTVLGAATLVKKTGIHPAVLKDQVTTPAGTTILALYELEDRGLRSMFVSAVEAATLRSAVLSKKSDQH